MEATTSTGYHPPEEEYLAAIRDLHEDGADVIQARLAERLGYSAPSVSAMLKRLEQSGLVEIHRDRKIGLTSKGRTRAESVVRRHRLAERLLTDILGLDWHLAHDEASRWEHVISDVVEARLLEVLDYPDTCPHGNPIPGFGDERTDLIPLADISANSEIVIERITETIEVDLELIRYLDENSIRPGAHFVISKVSPDGTFTLDAGGASVAVGTEIAENLYVSLP